MFKAKWYEDLHLPEDAKMIRDEVFVKEQKFQDEYDDMEVKALHLVIYDEENQPVATARMFPWEENSYKFGRIAVRKPWRGQGLGRILMEELEKKAASLGGKQALIGAQQQARGFYEKCGYIAYGDEYYEEYCPHIHMKKQI